MSKYKLKYKELLLEYNDLVKQHNNLVERYKEEIKNVNIDLKMYEQEERKRIKRYQRQFNKNVILVEDITRVKKRNKKLVKNNNKLTKDYNALIDDFNSLLADHNELKDICKRAYLTPEEILEQEEQFKSELTVHFSDFIQEIIEQELKGEKDKWKI